MSFRLDLIAVRVSLALPKDTLPALEMLPPLGWRHALPLLYVGHKSDIPTGILQKGGARA